MLTSPKVSDPFQVVRMTPRSIRGNGLILPPFRGSCTRDASRLPACDHRPHDRPSLARRRRPATAGHGLPRPARRRLARGHLGRGGRAGREPRERPPGARRPEGRRFRDARPDDPRMGTVRLRTRPGRCRRRTGIRQQLAEGRRLRPRALGVGRRPLRGREPSGRRSTSERASLPGLRHVLTFDDLPMLEAEGATFKAEHPSALDDAVAAIDEDDLFTFIYTSGTTGPPKGCMIRHRNYYAMVVGDRPPAGLRPRRRRDAAVPPARTQLRAADAPRPGRMSGTRSRSCPTRCRRQTRSRSVRPSVLPSVPRVYEKIHTAVVGAIDETTGAKRRLADWSLRIGREVSRREEARRCPWDDSLAARRRVADKLVFAKIRERLGGRLRTPISGGAPLVTGDRRVLRRDRDPDPRGLRADRMHDGGDDEHATSAGGSGRSAWPCPGSS